MHLVHGGIHRNRYIDVHTYLCIDPDTCMKHKLCLWVCVFRHKSLVQCVFQRSGLCIQDMGLGVLG